eukprot:4186128-Prymnesium_polylepis.1
MTVPAASALNHLVSSWSRTVNKNSHCEEARRRRLSDARASASPPWRVWRVFREPSVVGGEAQLMRIISGLVVPAKQQGSKYKLNWRALM